MIPLKGEKNPPTLCPIELEPRSESQILKDVFGLLFTHVGKRFWIHSILRRTSPFESSTK